MTREEERFIMRLLDRIRQWSDGDTVDNAIVQRLEDEFDALTPRTCGTCRHYDGDHGTTDGVRYGFCTNRHAWHAGRSMPPFDGCIAWAARDEDDGA
jgi:hypothetical protein